MDPIRLYIATGELPNDRGRAHKIQIQSATFSLIDEGQYVLAELHEGICGNHPGGRTLAHRA